MSGGLPGFCGGIELCRLRMVFRDIGLDADSPWVDSEARELLSEHGYEAAYRIVKGAAEQVAAEIDKLQQTGGTRP